MRLTEPARDGEATYPVGSTGTVVHSYRGGEAFEVEITQPSHGVVTVEAKAIEALPG